MGRITDTVKILLIVNIIFYLGSLFVGEYAYNLFALYFPLNDNFFLWQIVTHMFMHDPTSFLHIFFNMFLLYMFGSHIENFIGKNKFIFLYFSAGLGAAGLQLLFQYIDFYPGYQAFLGLGIPSEEVIATLNIGKYDTRVLDVISNNELLETFSAFNSTAVGASGALFGVLAAFAVMFPNLPLMIMFIPIPIKAKYLIGGYFLLNVYSAITGHSIIGPANTAYWAHIGGAIIGFIMMYYWKKNSFNDKRWY